MPSRRHRRQSAPVYRAMCRSPPELHATALARPATVVRDRGAILDAGDFEAGSLERTNRGFATRTRALHENGYLAQTVLLSHLGGRFRSHLCGERRRLARALEAHGACRLPGDHVA